MYNTDIFQAFKSRAEQRGDKSALIFGTHEISYHRLLDAVERLAHSMKNLGVSQGDPFAIMLPNVPQLIISYFALLKLGATVVLVKTDYEPTILQSVLEGSKIKGVVTLDRHIGTMRRIFSSSTICEIMICLGESVPNDCLSLTDLIANSTNHSIATDIDITNPALICFTAGTTASPKGVLFSHENLMAQVYSIRHALSFNKNHTVFCLLPLSHIFANAVNMTAALISGCTIVLFTKFDATQVIDAIRLRSNIVLFATPAIYESLSGLSLRDDIHIVNAVCIGGFLPKHVRERCRKNLRIPILNSYGLSEAGPLITTQDRLSKKGMAAVGLPSLGVELKIVEREKNEIRSTGLGEIVIRSANTMKGYIKSPDSGTTFSNGWLHTGDIGRLDLDGQLHFYGRKSNVILKAGFEVFPDEVENVLLTHPKIRACRVVAIKDDVVGEEVKALVVPVSSDPVLAKELSRHCSRRLAAYKCPKHYEIVQALTG